MQIRQSTEKAQQKYEQTYCYDIGYSPFLLLVSVIRLLTLHFFFFFLLAKQISPETVHYKQYPQVNMLH